MHDALVVGLGAMGSAALYHVASRGRRVVGVDTSDPPHTLGSTHGRTRIIREAYYEHPSYVPLVRRAYENWSALEHMAGTTLFQRTGGLMVGAPESGLITGTLDSARTHAIAVETLDAHAIARRFPGIAAEPHMVGVHEANAGILFPEECVRSYLSLARALGADIRPNTKVLSLRRGDGAITAVTTAGSVTARQLIITAGPWTASLLDSIGVSVPLVVERQTMHWFEPSGAAQASPSPIALVEHEPDRYCYALPDLGDGVKAAIHYEGDFVSPDTVDRRVGESDTAPVKELVARFFPGASATIRESIVCLYTNTPDRHFIVDTLDNFPGVTLVSACSGHGFKFASAIGEVVAQLALGEPTSVDLTQFCASRFA